MYAAIDDAVEKDIAARRTDWLEDFKLQVQIAVIRTSHPVCMLFPSIVTYYRRVCREYTVLSVRGNQLMSGCIFSLG